jgi:hypothetical protein
MVVSPQFQGLKPRRLYLHDARSPPASTSHPIFFAAGRRDQGSSIVIKETRQVPMLYAIFCYDSEEVVGAWTQDQCDSVLAKLAGATEKLAKRGKLGPVARLMPTTTATTLRKGKQPVVIDGPFAETKEALLGFYIVSCESLEEVVEIASEFARASSGTGSYELRPVAQFEPGGHVS